MITRRFFAVLTALILVLCPALLTGCGENNSPDFPAPDAASYCYDPAGVLTPGTENHIITLNDALFALTGAQIVVACVDTTGATDISSYARSLFNSWGIGSAEEKNGVLVLLSIGEDDYWTLQGEGLEDTLPSGTLKIMQNTYLEPGFAAKDYDSGVRLYFDALVSHLETLYSVDLDTWSGAPGEYTPGGSTDSDSDADVGVSGIIMIAIIIVIVILIIVILTSGKGGGGGSSSGRRRSPTTVSIPRTVVRGGYIPNTRPTVRPPIRPSGGSSFGGSRGPSGGFRGGGGSSRGGGAGRR